MPRLQRESAYLTNMSFLLSEVDPIRLGTSVATGKYAVFNTMQIHTLVHLVTQQAGN